MRLLQSGKVTFKPILASQFDWEFLASHYLPPVNQVGELKVNTIAIICEQHAVCRKHQNRRGQTTNVHLPGGYQNELIRADNVLITAINHPTGRNEIPRNWLR